MLELGSKFDAQRIQQQISKSSTESICTQFCQTTFLDYHEESGDSSVLPEYLMGEESGIKFVFPFNEDKGSDDSARIVSHSGSPYSGLCIDSSDPEIIKSAYSRVFTWFEDSRPNFSEIEVRLPPKILAESVSSHEWALWSLAFGVEAMYFGRYLNPKTPSSYNRNRKRRLSKLTVNNFNLKTTSTPTQEAYEILVKNRMDRHAARPIHSIHDFKLIEDANPGTLKTLLLCHEKEPCSTVVIFADDDFSTIQYLAGSECSFTCGSQDYLVDRVISEARETGKILLFGTSTIPTSDHREINSGLDIYKHSFGGLPYTAGRFIKRK